ncbi:MAG: molybdopterin-synthase adenylyltransferase MoeB [Pseudomonadota bacterium]
MLSDKDLERFSRQILLHDFDIAGQEKLLAARVLVVGLGGLGAPAALYLAAAGVGHLALADGDVVELANLQRQISHGEADINRNKAASTADALRAIRPEISLTVLEAHLAGDALQQAVAEADVVVDATDNYPARFALNRACLATQVPLVSGAAVRGEGQLAVFHARRGGPCYRCLYPKEGEATALSCSESGVIAPLVGVVGSMQALEVIKLITGYGESLQGQLLVLDLARMDIRRLSLKRREDCPDCGDH